MMMRCIKSNEAAQTSYHDVAMQLEVDIHVGLSEYEVDQRRRNHGYNEFDITDDDPLWKKYLGQARYHCVLCVMIERSSRKWMGLSVTSLYFELARTQDVPSHGKPWNLVRPFTRPGES